MNVLFQPKDFEHCANFITVHGLIVVVFVSQKDILRLVYCKICVFCSCFESFLSLQKEGC